MPNILIAIPCFDSMMSDFAFSLARLVNVPGYNATVLDIRGSEISVARNSACKAALDGDYTHLCFLDSDMHLPADTISRLLGHGKPVVGAAYIRRCAPFDLLARFPAGTRLDSAELVEADELPGGCLLISVAVLRKVGWPWFRIDYGAEYGERVGEDIWFCRKVRDAGVKIWCDMRLSREVAHVGTRRYTLADGIEYVRWQHAP